MIKSIFRSLGYLPFSPDSDSLLSRQEPEEVSSSKLKSVGTFQDNTERPSIQISRDSGNGAKTGSFFRATPSVTNTGQFTNLELQLMRPQTNDENTRLARTNIEALLNRLSITDKQKFLEQFSRLNQAEQQYAFKQFISSPVNVQQFALNQFLNLDPEVLKISIDREILAENREPSQQESSKSLRQPIPIAKAPSITQNVQHRFQTNFN